MAHADPLRTNVFLSIIRYSGGMSAEQMCAVIGEASGLDAHMLRLMISRPPPQVLGLVSPERAADTIEAISGAGGDAFAPAMADLEALGESIKLKGLVFAGDVIHAEPWRGKPVTIRADSIRTIVRGMLDDARSPAAGMDRPIGDAIPTTTVGPGKAEITGIVLEAFSRRLRHVMNVHTSERRVFQVDALKFNFEVLGDQRGPSDLHNIQILERRLTAVAPDAVVDTYYSLWTPPQQHARLRLPGRLINNEDTAFAFYSRWVALMYEHITGRSAAPG